MRKIIIFLLILLFLYWILGGFKLLILLSTLLSIYFIFFFVSKKQYKICVVTAQTGGGKTLYCNSIVQKYVKRNKQIDKINKRLSRLKKNLIPKYNIYTTFYSEGCYMLKSDFFNYKYPKNSILVVDEAHMSLDSRGFSQAVKNGNSLKLLGALSLHRHHKLDLYFITQQPEEIDVRVRRYCNELITLDRIIFFRRFYKVAKKLKIETKIPPLLILYHKWDRVYDYEAYQENRKHNNYAPSQFGAKFGMKLIKKIDRESYDTDQEDSFYESLQDVVNKNWADNKGATLDTGINKGV